MCTSTRFPWRGKCVQGCVGDVPTSRHELGEQGARVRGRRSCSIVGPGGDTRATWGAPTCHVVVAADGYCSPSSHTHTKSTMARTRDSARKCCRTSFVARTESVLTCCTGSKPPRGMLAPANAAQAASSSRDGQQGAKPQEDAREKRAGERDGSAGAAEASAADVERDNGSGRGEGRSGTR